MINKLILIVAIAILYVSPVFGQPLPLRWQHCYGGSDHDEASSVIPAWGGGFIVSGWAISEDGDRTSGTNGRGDYWVIRIDDHGTILWQRSYGGSGYDYGTCLIRTPFGYAVGGYANSSDGEVTGLHGLPFPHSSPDYWVVGIDTSGNMLWEKTYGGTSYDELYSMATTSDSGLILAGLTLSSDGDVTHYHGEGDAWVVRTNDTGGIKWQRTLGGRNYDVGWSILQTNDGGYIMAGHSNSDSTDTAAVLSDLWIVKLSDTGAITWQAYYGGTGDDGATSIVQTTDGGYIVAGHSKSTDGDVNSIHSGYDCWILKLNGAGGKQWSKVYGGSGDDEPNSIIQTFDGGYAVVGSSNSSDGDLPGNYGGYDAWVMKLTNTGTMQWQQIFGGSLDEDGTSIVQNADSGFTIAGMTGSDDHDVSGQHGLHDYWVFRLDKYGVGVPTVTSQDQLKIYPVPATDQLNFEFPVADNISIKLMDMIGRVTDVQTMHDVTSARFDVKGYVPGMYLYQFISNGKMQTGKVEIGR